MKSEELRQRTPFFLSRSIGSKSSKGASGTQATRGILREENPVGNLNTVEKGSHSRGLISGNEKNSKRGWATRRSSASTRK